MSDQARRRAEGDVADESAGAGTTAGDTARAYEAPAIAWREPYEPLSFGISCAKQPGNPGCHAGPYSS